MSNLGGIFTVCDLSNFDAKNYFKEYHFFEEFEENKVYSPLLFQEDFGFGNLFYKYKIYEIKDEKSEKKKKFIIVEEQLQQEELNKLYKFCQCKYHKMSWFNPLKLCICRCCIGCLTSPFPQQYVINETRKFIQNNF